MAEALMNPRRLVAAFALFAIAACAQAQSMQDPTRPALAGASDGESGAAPAGPQLESVLIARHPGGRNLAVINGDTVRQGDTYKGARVARITHSSVELVRGKDREVLQMSPPDETGSVVKRLARLQ
jgi:MSHA biogenesis protein MshK